MTDVTPTGEMQTGNTGQVDSPLNQLTEHNIHMYSGQSREAINKHIGELETEWSIERVIESGASVLSIIGIALGAFVSPWFLVLPFIISALFLVHAVSRVCPGLTLLQGKGKRTGCDIAAEKFAMRTLRGDGDSIPSDTEKAALAARTINATRAYSSAA